MKKPLLVTFDHNCIVALEKEEPEASALRQLIAFSRQGIIHIVIPWRTMLENPPQGKKPLWYPEQQQRMERLGLGDVELFKHHQTMWFPDEDGYLTYGPEFPYLQMVHKILFPNIDFGFPEYLKRYCEQHQLDPMLYADADYYTNSLTHLYSTPATWEQRLATEQEFEKNTDLMSTLRHIQDKWRNAKNDALGLCAHVSWRGDIFVTNDNHFHNKKPQLRSLVPSKILRPTEAVSEIRLLTSGIA